MEPSGHRRDAQDAELLRQYQSAQRRRNRSRSTVERYDWALRTLVEHLHADGAVLFNADPELVAAWAAIRGVAPRTQDWKLTAASSFYRWAIREGLTDRNPVDRLDRPEFEPGLPRPIADEDLALSLEMADDRMRCWLLLGAYAGLRSSEAAAIRREELLNTWDPPQLFVRRGKGRKQRYVPLHPDLFSALRIWGLPRSGPVFPGRYDSIRSRTLSNYAGRFFRGLGIDAQFHCLRHWFATRALEAAGGDLAAVQELLGHASPETTRVYTKVTIGRLAPIVTALTVKGPGRWPASRDPPMAAEPPPEEGGSH